jgi:general secretion pathway protein H
MYRRTELSRSPPKLTDQAGFTLIELMVVVVIMAVVVAVGVLSLGRLNQDATNGQQVRVEQYFKQVADEAVFRQKLLLLVPDEKGLNLYSKQEYKWQPDNAIESYQWPESFEVEWQFDETIARQQKLKNPGWIIWPSGEVVPGKITLKLISESDEAAAVIEWNQLLEFNRPEE